MGHKPIGATDHVRRYLVIANQTLSSPELHDLIRARAVPGETSFHMLVPQVPTPAIHTDPSGLIDPSLQDSIVRSREIARQDAEQRLAAFIETLAETGASITGEVSSGDPLVAARRAMEETDFDEIIVSTLPARISRWLKLDLPNRVQRAFNLPLTSLIQRD